MASIENKVENLIKEKIEKLGYELYDVEYAKEAKNFFLRIYIESEKGISLEDCEKVSNEINEPLDKSNRITEAYFLEVSSPGLNRGLFTDDHFKKQIEKEIMVRFTKSLDGRKNVKGILKEVNDDSIVVEADKLVTIPKDKIKSANLEGEI